MENGGNHVPKKDENQTVERDIERQEGDGNDSTYSSCSPPRPVSNDVSGVVSSRSAKDPPCEEKPVADEKVPETSQGENKEEETRKSTKEEETRESEECLGKERQLAVQPQHAMEDPARVQERKSNGFATEKIANSVQLATSSRSLSFKELRQQLKQLYGQELIRRILQASVVTNGQGFKLIPDSVQSLSAVAVDSTHGKVKPPCVAFDQVKQESSELDFKSAQQENTNQDKKGDCCGKFETKPEDPKDTLLRDPGRLQLSQGHLELDTEDKTAEPYEPSDQTSGVLDKKSSAQPTAPAQLQPPDQQVLSHIMQGSKSSPGEKSTHQTPQRDGSDHSDSVVSLQSSSSDDGKPHREASLEEANIPVGQDVNEPKETCDTQECGALSNPNVDRLHQKFQDQPTQDTLDEIIYMLKNQNSKDSPCHLHDRTEQRRASPLPWHQDSALDGNPFKSTQSYPGSSLAWNPSVSPLQFTVGQISGHQKLREKHSRQLKDVTAHYESEIDKLRDQLEDVRNNLSALQDVLPVKMLESENTKLEKRCCALEQMCEQLKIKSVRLEQTNQELDSFCGQLKQGNQNLEVRCLYLEQVNQTNDSERVHLQQNIRDLEAKVLELVESSERAMATCHHLEDANHKSEARNQALEESRALLETRYKNCIGENHKLDAQVNQLQKALEEYIKKCKEMEDSIVALHRKKESLIVELDVSAKMGMTTQQKFEEIKSKCVSKDELIARLENELKELAGFVEKTIKEKAQADQNSKRDKELLQRMLIEYDVLAKNHLESRNSSRAVQEKLDLLQDEINSLRGTISKLISRNNSLEESLVDNLTQESRHSDYLKPFSGRRTWEHSTPIKKGDSQHQSLRAPYAVTEPEEKSFGTGSCNSRPYNASPATPGSFLHPDKLSETPVAKASSSSGKRQESVSSRPKTAYSAGQAKRNLMEGFGESSKESSEAKHITPKTQSGMVVKKADLVTRFDVVFEDSQSGKEVLRSHTGRTRRSYGEPAHTELSFLDGEARPRKGTAEAALSAVKEGRVVGMGGLESKSVPKGSKSKQHAQALYNLPEKDTNSEHTQGTSNDNDETGVHVMERRFSVLSEERKRLESTLSRIPSQKMTRRTKEDKAYLEDRLDDVVKEIGSVRMQLKRHHAL